MPPTLNSRVLASGSAEPVFYAAVAFAIGIVVGTYTWRPSWWLLIAALLFVAGSACLWSTRPRTSGALAVLALVTLGILHAQLDLASPSELPDIAPFADETEHIVIAHVLRSGLIKNSALGMYGSDASSPEHRQTIDVET